MSAGCSVCHGVLAQFLSLSHCCLPSVILYAWARRARWELHSCQFCTIWPRSKTPVNVYESSFVFSTGVKISHNLFWMCLRRRRFYSFMIIMQCKLHASLSDPVFRFHYFCLSLFPVRFTGLKREREKHFKWLPLPAGLNLTVHFLPVCSWCVSSQYIKMFTRVEQRLGHRRGLWGFTISSLFPSLICPLTTLQTDTVLYTIHRCIFIFASVLIEKNGVTLVFPARPCFTHKGL